MSLRQRIGRGLRGKKSGPNIALIVDIAYEINNCQKGHTLQRRAIITGTPGFDRNVLAHGADFDFTVLGLALKIA